MIRERLHGSSVYENDDLLNEYEYRLNLRPRDYNKRLTFYDPILSKGLLNMKIYRINTSANIEEGDD